MNFLLLMILLPVYCFASFNSESESYLFRNLTQNKGLQKNLTQTKERIINHLSFEFTIKVENSDRINAFAGYNEDDLPQITITEGMLTHPLMDQEVLTLLLCHELGHYQGGFPKQFRGRSQKRSWSTAEGQADYFSIAVCLRKMTQKKDLSNMTKTAIKLSKIYAEVKFWPYELKADDPDRTIVHTTDLLHPNPQCRLDTFLAALRCPKIKQIKRENEVFYTCEDENFRQPTCWMAPSTFQDI